MTQLKTQTARYWQEDLVVDDQDLEYLYGLLLEGSMPQTPDQLALALMEWRCRSEEAAIKAELERGEPYRPKDSYEVGQQIVFPALGYALATVTGVRPGYNPQYDPFKVIQVRFEGEEEGTREFAAELDHPHRLNTETNNSQLLTGKIAPIRLYATYGSQVRQKLEERLQTGTSWEFVKFGDEWFLKGLMADIHVGHRNIAEAALDVKGAPLPPEELLKVLELSTDLAQPAQLFSLNYALRGDDRFDDVGTDDNILWFLRRLEPPEAIHPPRRLQYSPQPYSREISDELLELEREIEDEATEPTVFGPYPPEKPVHTVVFALTYPHYRVGTIPLTPRLAALFPQSNTQRTRITIIDGRSGRKMIGWVVHQHKYVCGLGKWYKEHNIPVGAHIRTEQTKDPLTFIVDYEPRRTKREWIRVAKAVEGKPAFGMQKWPVGCQYDDLMIVGEDKPVEIDSLWVAAEEREKPILEIIREVFPELAKLSPQGTVHAKTLYSAVNVVKRCPPGPIFAELCTQDCFNSVGNGYWTMTA